MASAGTVTLELDANSVKLIREMQKAQKQTKTSANSMGKDMKKAFTSMRDEASKNIKMFGMMAAAALAAAGAIVRSQANELDKLAKTSDAIGIQQERLQALKLMADLTGAGADQLSGNLERMQRNLGRAARDGGATRDALESVGVSIKDIIGLSPDKQLEMLAKAIGGVENQSVKASIASDLFGREGLKMLNLLKSLEKDGLQPTVEMMDKMGVSLSRVETFKIEQMNDALRIAQERSKSMAQQFTIGVSTGVTALANMYSANAQNLGGFASDVEEILDNLIEGAINLAVSLGPAFDLMKSGFSSIIDGFNSLPTWAKEIGLFGVLVFGKKGAAALIGIAMFNDFTNKMRDEVNFYIGVVDDAAEEAKESFSILNPFGSSSNKDWEDWGKNFSANLNKQKDKIKHAREFFVPLPSIMGELDGDSMGGLQDNILRQLESIALSTRTQADKIKADMELVKQAIDSGITQPFTDAGTTAEAVLAKLNQDLLNVKQPLTEMDEFTKKAAQGMQSAFADFLFNPFEEGIKGMLKSFTLMLARMAAEAMAARILQQLFGGLAGSSNALLSSIGGAFAAPAVPGVRDVGGRGEAGKPYIINPKAGPELFIPKTAGEFIPNIDEMGGGMNLNLTIDARDAGAEARIKDMIIREMVPQIISAAKQDTIRTLRRPRFA